MRLSVMAVFGVLFPFIASAASAADTPPAAAPTAASQQDPANEVICRRMTVTGTRVGGKSVCKTRREWEQQQQNAKDLLNDVTNKSLTATPSGG